MKILLFGGNGQVGSALKPILSGIGDLCVATRKDVDFSDPVRLGPYIRSISPDVIVNAAAYTAVDRAQEEPDLAHIVNAVAPGILAQEAARLGATLVHYSTDYVFDGSGDRPWAEEDSVNPLSVYGRSKAEGEQRVLQSACRAFIFRTSWVYSIDGHNFLKTILRAASTRETLDVVCDQIGSPTGSALIAEITGDVIERRAEIEHGVYHLTAAGFTNWFEYASYLIEMAKMHAAKGFIATRAVNPIKSIDRPSPAPRPLNSRLNTDKLQRALGLEFPSWQEGVDDVAAKLMKEKLL